MTDNNSKEERVRKIMGLLNMYFNNGKGIKISEEDYTVPIGEGNCIEITSLNKQRGFALFDKSKFDCLDGLVESHARITNRQIMRKFIDYRVGVAGYYWEAQTE